MPFTNSWMANRFPNVVLPEEEGPAMVSDLGNLFLVQGLAYLNHIPGVFMFDGLV